MRRNRDALARLARVKVGDRSRLLVKPTGGLDHGGAPGAFGEKSVLLMPGYAAPRWLRDEGVAGSTRELVVRGHGLGARIRMSIWSPKDADPAEGLPLLAAHDGPEYDRLAALTRFTAVGIRTGELPRHRVALLAPGMIAVAGGLLAARLLVRVARREWEKARRAPAGSTVVSALIEFRLL